MLCVTTFGKTVKEIHGIAEKVFSRGKLAYEFDGDKFHVEKGHGKFCPRNDFDQNMPLSEKSESRILKNLFQKTLFKLCLFKNSITRERLQTKSCRTRAIYWTSYSALR